MDGLKRQHLAAKLAAAMEDCAVCAALPTTTQEQKETFCLIARSLETGVRLIQEMDKPATMLQ